MQGVLDSYKGNFAFALAAWPMISAFLTLPLLAYIYHRNGKLGISSILAAYLSVLYMIGLACFTLYPLPSGTSGPGITYSIEPQLIPFQCIADVFKDGAPALFQIVANIILFIPLGFIASRFLRMGPFLTAGFGLGVSLLIEVTQLTGIFGIYPYSFRMFDVDDLMTNTAGTLIGLMVAKGFTYLVPEQQDRHTITDSPGFTRRLVAFWMDMTLVGTVAAMAGILLIFATTVFGYISGSDTVINVFSVATGWGTFAAAWIAFIVFEAVIPWFCEGQTMGGVFVRMTFETKDRQGARRIVFYILRGITLILAIAFPFAAIPALGIFYLAKRCMPYDLV